MQDFASKMYKPKTKANGKKGFLFYFLKWLLIALIICFSVSFLSRPVRKSWSNDYLERGNIYLEQKRYLSADLEYKKALLLFPQNNEAREQKELGKKTQKDILLLRDFIDNQNIDQETVKFEKATAVPKTPAEATATAKELIEAEEYQLAIVPAETATQMDANYKDGWFYLGVANFLTAQNLELDQGVKNNYLSKAKEFFEKAKTLGMDSATIDEFLSKIEM